MNVQRRLRKIIISPAVQYNRGIFKITILRSDQNFINEPHRSTHKTKQNNFYKALFKTIPSLLIHFQIRQVRTRLNLTVNFQKIFLKIYSSTNLMKEYLSTCLNLKFKIPMKSKILDPDLGIGRMS